jgi:hypothetical protein
MKKHVFLVAGLLAISGPTWAEMFAYSISGTGSGSLSGVTFSNNAFTFTLVGDTANLTTDLFDGSQAIDPLTSASVNLDGIGLASFDSVATRLGRSATSIAFFSRSPNGLDLFDFELSAPVDLGNAFSGVTGSNVSALTQFIDVVTSLGALTFTASSNVVFSGMSLTPVSQIPEPQTYALLLAGLGVVGTVAARRKAASV